MRVWFAVETSLDLIGTNIGAELEELYLPQVVDTALVRRWRQPSGVLRTFTNKHWINCITLLYCSPQAARSIYPPMQTREDPATVPHRFRDAVPTCCFPSKSVQSLANTNKLDMPQRR